MKHSYTQVCYLLDERYTSVPPHKKNKTQNCTSQRASLPVLHSFLGTDGSQNVKTSSSLTSVSFTKGNLYKEQTDGDFSFAFAIF